LLSEKEDEGKEALSMTVSIGVLAGMGPRSTAPFIDMLVTDCQVGDGAKYDLDFP